MRQIKMSTHRLDNYDRSGAPTCSTTQAGEVGGGEKKCQSNAAIICPLKCQVFLNKFGAMQWISLIERELLYD